MKGLPKCDHWYLRFGVIVCFGVTESINVQRALFFIETPGRISLSYMYIYKYKNKINETK